MALFHRKEHSQTETYYTVGMSDQQTKLIIGLGNVGRDYTKTRHNVGFMGVDAYAATEQGAWAEKKSLKSYVCELRVGQSRVILIKPTTLMNNSGEAVQAVQHFYKIKNQDTLIIHDELDIPFGQIRVRCGGNAAGHNGIKSVIAHCGEDFYRIRTGIKSELSAKSDSAAYVLQQFSKEETDILPQLIQEIGVIVNEFVYGGALQAETRNII